MTPKIFADFLNADAKGRIRLNCRGTQDDLVRENIRLEAGLELTLDDDEGIATNGKVEFSEDENIWVAKIVG